MGENKYLGVNEIGKILYKKQFFLRKEGFTFK